MYGLVFTLCIQLVFLYAQRQPTVVTMHGVWETPPTLAKAKQESRAIVVARVTAVTQLPDILHPHPTKEDPNAVYREQTQRITFDALKTIHGNVGSQFELGHFGSDTRYVEDDPPYRVDETYVMFLKPMETDPNAFLVLAPTGRYRVVNDTLEVMPEVHAAYAEALRGKPVAALEQALAQIR